ncbi:PQ loop repeat-domain-containing protein [Scenedesmus sp. NREL 46B-D3]|nr:PQ loop repeat-domain-containing protein [Scenedesmus sp. NREL 46B-D3]
MGCEPGANAFIEKYFADCVYNLRDYIGFCLGISAILFWLVAQIPQYVRNYKTKSAEALSPWFLASWLLGDTTNLLGCLLQGQQLPTTTYTAMYFVMADVFMMMQYIYYVRDLAYTVGTALGYCSSVLYLCSRLSQIYKNYSRQSSEGLALAMFMMAVCANSCTGTGIILRTFTKTELLEQLPWILGTLGTISLDMVILWQSLKYASKANLAWQAAAGGDGDGSSSEERRQLLNAQHHQHQVTVHLHHQQPALPREGHAPLVGGASSRSHSRAMAIPAAADRHITSGDGISFFSSSAPAMPGWGGALSHRPDAGRRHAVAAAADHVDGAEEVAPLLQAS